MAKRKTWIYVRSLQAKCRKLPQNGGRFASNDAVEKYYEKQVWLHLSKVGKLPGNSNGQQEKIYMIEEDEDDEEDEMEGDPEEDEKDEEVQELMRSEESTRTEEQVYEQRRFEETDRDLWISEFLVGYQAKNPHASVEEMTSYLLSESLKMSTISRNSQHQRTDILDEPRTIFNTLKYIPGNHIVTLMLIDTKTLMAT